MLPHWLHCLLYSLHLLAYVSEKMNPGKTMTLQALRKEKEKWSRVGKIHIQY